jgi:hypothetical protein
MMKMILAIGLATCVIASPAAAAKPVKTGTPVQIERLMACRAMTDPVQRLACFDREVAGVQTAIGTKELVVIDKTRVREARRDLFGFSVPSFGGLFGGDAEDEIKQVEGVVTSVGRNPEGGLIIRLVDKSVWTQTDDSVIAIPPKKGDKVTVRRATLGSFRMSVDGQPGVRVKRIG